MEKKTENAGLKAVIVTGPESTGKTTVAKFLAENFRGAYFPELAREYIEQLERNYIYNDIVYIAKQQKEQLDKAMQNYCDIPVFFDTFLIITKIWMLWNSGKYENWMDEYIKKTNDAIYLLCAPDLEWIADNVRENGGEKRFELFNLYKQELKNNNLKYVIIEGQDSRRFENARKAVNEYLIKK